MDPHRGGELSSSLSSDLFLRSGESCSPVEAAGFFPQPLTRICLCKMGKPSYVVLSNEQETHLECIFPRKALLAPPAREWFNRKMYPLVPLQIVIPIEALRTLITLERSLVVCWLRLGAIHLLLQMCCVPTVIPRY